MKYYVTADVHSYYDELMTALTEKGFFEEQTPHKLIICGDLFDRGTQAAKMQAFILELLAKDRVILIRGALFLNILIAMARLTAGHCFQSDTAVLF